jgi:predicted dehydrogenase
MMGAGIIAEKMAQAIAIVDGCTLLGVASKSPERAKIFAERHKTAEVHTYQSLVNCPAIDVVYVATTHNFHFDNARMALEAGKHVLIEKPITVNAKEAAALQVLAAENGCFMMEGLWTRCLPAMILLKKMILEGAIGEVKALQISFGGMASTRYQQRLYSPELAGGVTLDMGIYPLSVACFLMDGLPVEHKSMARFRESGVDELAQYMLRFPGDRFASLLCSFALPMTNEASVYGTQGRMHMPNFHVGDAFECLHYGEGQSIADRQWHRPVQADNGFVHEVEEVLKCLRAGKLESDLMPISESVAVMEIMDAMRKEWGLKYPYE